MIINVRAAAGALRTPAAGVFGDGASLWPLINRQQHLQAADHNALY